MKFLIVLCSALACSMAQSFISPYAYSGIHHLGYNFGYSAIAPAHVAYAAAPIAAGVKTQYHAQDELGQASYGHSEPLQAHSAVQDAAGNKVGSFSYVSPEGNVFKTDYVADGLGYRVASNALPVGPSHLPLPVADTPEVVAARAAHLAEHALARSRARRGIGHTPAATAPLAVHAPLAYSAHHIAAAPIAHHYAAPVAHHIAAPYAHHHIAAPVAYSAHHVAAPVAYSAHHVAAPVAVHHAVPAVRAATLTTVVNNPGHSVSYRVD